MYINRLHQLIAISTTAELYFKKMNRCYFEPKYENFHGKYNNFHRKIIQLNLKRRNEPNEHLICGWLLFIEAIVAMRTQYEGTNLISIYRNSLYSDSCQGEILLEIKFSIANKMMNTLPTLTISNVPNARLFLHSEQLWMTVCRMFIVYRTPTHFSPFFLFSLIHPS